MGEPEISTRSGCLINYKEKMYFYSSEISGMPECTLSLIMRKQSHNSKLRDILIGMDFSKIFTS